MKIFPDQGRPDEASDGGSPRADQTGGNPPSPVPTRRDVEAALIRLVDAILPESRSGRHGPPPGGRLRRRR